MQGGAPGGGSNMSQASKNLAEPWGRSDGWLDREGPTGTAGGGGEGASQPFRAGQARLAQRPAEKEVLVVEAWEQLL